MSVDPTAGQPEWPRLISYAQNAEDIVLYRALGDIEGGFYVDIGANEPTHDSVTKFFYDRGWSGINVEPQVSCFENLQAARPRDINLNLGVGDEVGQLTLYLVPEAKAMSSFSLDHANQVRELGYHIKETSVQIQTLSQIFTDHVGSRTVDFLKVDVEGFESAVLGAFPWDRWRPRVLIVESNPDIAPWEQRLVESGYRRVQWDGINLYFVRLEDADRLGQRLSQPATFVLDRYDPWLYVEPQLLAQQRLGHVLSYYLRHEFARRGAHASESSAAADALANAVSHRPDVLEHYGTPAATNTDLPRIMELTELLKWAATSAERPDEAYTADLINFASTYRRLAFAPVGIDRSGVSSPPITPRQRLSSLYERAKLALPSGLRRRLGAGKRWVTRRFNR